MVTSLGQQQFFFANSCATQDVIWEDTRPAWIAWSYTCVMCWKCGFCIAARSFMGAWRDQWCFWTYHGKGMSGTHVLYFMHACPPACRCIEEQWPPNSCLTLCCLFMHDLCTASWCPTCMACTIFWTPLHVQHACVTALILQIFGWLAGQRQHWGFWYGLFWTGSCPRDNMGQQRRAKSSWSKTQFVCDQVQEAY